ncbi:hypothetical protein JCM10207_000595 [Rhodosporidiobolus poonsookiae]
MASLPPPTCSIDEAHAILSGPGQPFEMEDKVIKGRRVKAYKYLPASVRDLWVTSQAAFADKEYLVYEEERYTYRQANERVVHLASLLHARGVKKGDRVAVAMRNLPEWIFAWLAAHSLGAIVVAVNAWLTPDAFFHCLSITEPTVVFVDDERERVLASRVDELRAAKTRALFVVRGRRAPAKGFERLEEALKQHRRAELPKVDIVAEDPAIIFFTSGTTSLPKGVLSTQRQYLSNRINTAAGAARSFIRKGEPLPKPDPTAPQRSCLLIVPLFHVMGNHSFFCFITATGGKLVLMHKFSPTVAARLIREEEITATGGVPNMVTQIMDALDQDPQGWKGLKLEGLSLGGAPASGRIPEDAKKRLPSIASSQGYGLTEVNSVATGLQGDDYLRYPTSAGVAPPAVSLKIIDPSSPQPVSSARALPTGQVGEVCIFGPNVAEGYWRDEEATAKAFDKEGWFRSGDLGYLNDEGFLFICDRAKDIIIRSGENISSVQVEDALFKAHDAVKEVAVVPVPCEQHGEQVAAVVVLHPPSHPSRSPSSPACTESSLRSLLGPLLPRHCVPALIVFPAEFDTDAGLPKNATGKVLKKEVKGVAEREWERRGLGKKVRAKL